MALEKCVKRIGAHFIVFTKLHHVSSRGRVEVFYLYNAIFVNMSWQRSFGSVFLLTKQLKWDKYDGYREVTINNVATLDNPFLKK